MFISFIKALPELIINSCKLLKINNIKNRSLINKKKFSIFFLNKKFKK